MKDSIIPAGRCRTGRLLACAAGLATMATGLPAAAQDNTVPRQTLSNIETGISMDRFIGDASTAVTSVSHDVIMTRPILTTGDPTTSGPRGAVLRYRNSVALGMMAPGEVSSLAGVEHQLVIYVERGHARIDDGQRSWELHPGYAAIVPANVPHRFTNAGDEQLAMLMMEEPATDAVNAAGIVVRDTAKLLYVENGAHWSNLSKAPFSDLGERILIVSMGPMSIAGAHAHTEDTEEGWVKLTDAPALMQIGSEIRPWKANMGMISPPNDKSVHAAINISDEIQSWFYFQHAMGRQRTGESYPRDNPAIKQAETAATVQPVALGG